MIFSREMVLLVGRPALLRGRFEGEVGGMSKKEIAITAVLLRGCELAPPIALAQLGGLLWRADDYINAALPRHGITRVGLLYREV